MWRLHITLTSFNYFFIRSLIYVPDIWVYFVEEIACQITTIRGFYLTIAGATFDVASYAN